MAKRSPIETLLADTHKQIAQSGFAIAAMLSRRKLNLAALRSAREQLKIALDTFDKSLEQLAKEVEE